MQAASRNIRVQQTSGLLLVVDYVSQVNFKDRTTSSIDLNQDYQNGYRYLMY